MKYTLPILSILLVLSISNAWSDEHTETLNKQLDQIEAQLPNELGPAQRMMEQLLESHPNHAEVNYYCGVIYGLRANEGMFSAMRNAQKSRECTERAVVLEPTNMKYQLAAFNYYASAPGIVGGGEKKARAKAAEIAELDELQGVLAHVRVISVFDKNNYTAALTQVLANYPGEPRLQLRLGLQLQSVGNYAEAHDLFLKASRNISDNPEVKATQINALYQLARNAVFSKARIEEGITSMKRYIALFDTSLELPDLPWAHARLAQLMKLAENNDGMKHHRKLAQKLGRTNDDDLHELLARL